MTFPQQLAQLLKKHPGMTRKRILTQQVSCQGAKFHSPRPLEVHRVTVNQRSILLCGVCRDNLGLLTDLLDVEGEQLAWPVLREFGAGIRSLLRERTTHG